MNIPLPLLPSSPLPARRSRAPAQLYFRKQQSEKHAPTQSFEESSLKMPLPTSHLSPNNRPYTTATAITTADAFSPDTVCSPANRQRCLEQLSKQPPIRMNPPVSSAPKNADVPNEPEPREASVLIPLCTDADGQLGLLYTLRSASLNAHTRQVSFPGGMRDPTDATAATCALRETYEEIGLPPDQIEIWGPSVAIQPLKSPRITPIIAQIHHFRLADLRLNRAEVAEAFVVPLRTLCDPRHGAGHTQFRGRGMSGMAGFSVPLFRGGAHRVWGLTGVMTHMFLLALWPRGQRVAGGGGEPVYGRRKVPLVQPYRRAD